MKTICVFTPAFNRAHLLPRLYNSLCQQTSKDFIWLVVDDGSVDDTKSCVARWKSEADFEIQYVYKENGGMHTAHNTAYALIETELNVCIDSDDYMPNNAIELILTRWKAVDNKDRIAGIMGLDVFENQKIVSTRKFPEDVNYGKYGTLRGQYKLKGDIKFVYRTDIIKKYPNYPVFENEKFTPLGYKSLLIDQDYDMLFLNEPLCVVEYQADGSSNTIINQYFKSPNGFRFERNVRMKYAMSFEERFRNAMHYWSSSILLRDLRFISHASRKDLVILAMPFGLALHGYILYRQLSKKHSVLEKA